MSQANRNHVMAETSKSVYCIA